jgi:hypothetical protein
MKKILSLVSALALSALAFASTSVTMDFGDPTAYGYAKAGNGEFTQVADGQTITKEGVVATVNFTSGNGFRFFTHSTAGTVNLRGYVGATLTITPPTGKKILKIKANGSNLNTTYLAAGDGKISGTAWEGEADAVVFDVIKSTVQINTLTVDFGDAGDTPVVTKIDTIGVSDAIARIKAGNKGECYVLGVVAGDPFLLGGNGPAFYMTDIANAADSLEGFKIGKDANTPYASAEAMAADFGMGDTILIYAAGLDKYNSIFETTSGYFCKVLGKSSAVTLDWAVGSAVLTETGWDLEIAKANNDTKNLVNMKIVSTKKDGIKGQYPLAAGSSLMLNGSNTAITAGNITLNFKEIGPNSLNIYDVQATFNAGDKIYRIKQEVEFFAADANGDEIVLTGDRPFKPTEGQEITCAQAKEYAMSLAAGTTGDIKVTVVGYVTDLYSNGVTFWMDDQQGSAKTFQAYMVKTVQPAGVGLKNGAKVKVTGYVTNYNGTTPELKDGAVEIVEGGEQIVATEATVAEALAAAKALEQNKTSEGVYAITGYISSIVEEFKADKGNMSFWMSDNLGEDPQEFQAFRVSCTEELAAKLRPGAKVKVTAKVTHFHQDAKPAEGDQPEKPERTIYETAQGGSVELLQESAVEVIRADAPAVKFIENGQIIIIRNGVRYNVQGQLAK